MSSVLNVKIHTTCWQANSTYNDDFVEVYESVDEGCWQWSDKLCYEDKMLNVHKCEKSINKTWHREPSYSDNHVEVHAMKVGLLNDVCDYAEESVLGRDIYFPNPVLVPVMKPDYLNNGNEVRPRINMGCEQSNAEDMKMKDEKSGVAQAVCDGPVEISHQLHDVNAEMNKLEYNEKGRRKRKCCITGCKSAVNVSLHTFPSIFVKNVLNVRNLERCKLWIRNSGDINLLQIKINLLHKKYFLCSNHFETNQFHHPNRKRLRIDAVPTLFNACPIENKILADFPNIDPDFEIPEDLEAAYNTDKCQLSETGNCKLDKYTCEFENDMSKMRWYNCSGCNETFMSKQKLKKGCVHNNSCKDYSDNNDMDPGSLPEELKELSLVEEQLIARVNPIVSVYQVKKQQYKYSGNVINFSQEVQDVATKLPHRLCELNSILTVRAKRHNKRANNASEANNAEDGPLYIGFHVRAQKVRNALVWLKSHCVL